ncbi:MAG: hypothetical protein JWN86_2754 [Planctomycetota bacterium]|nr:hypothetical protein [Planctomycetota bacterium]
MIATNAADRSEFINTAVVASFGADPNASNNSSAVTTTVSFLPPLGVNSFRPHGGPTHRHAASAHGSAWHGSRTVPIHSHASPKHHVTRTPKLAVPGGATLAAYRLARKG